MLSSVKEILRKTKIFRKEAWLVPYELNGEESLLDVGCGEESFVERLNGVQRTGLDIFSPCLKISREKGIHNNYVNADLKHLPFRDNSFDVVFARECIEHQEKGEAVQAIKELERVAKRKVILTTPNGMVPLTPFDENPYQEHKCFFVPSELRKRGYSLRGLDGIKFLRGERGKITIPPRKIFRRISDLSQMITYYIPEISYRLFAVKEL